MPVKIILTVCLLLLWPVLSGSASIDMPARVNIKPITNLQQDAELARTQRLPILIAFTASYCHYCEVVKEEFLKPMLRNKAYRNKVLIREAVLDSYTQVRDFSGQEISLDNLALKYRAYLTPTVILLGPDGNEISERLTGVTTVDFYGGYLDDAIDEALAKLQP